MLRAVTSSKLRIKVNGQLARPFQGDKDDKESGDCGLHGQTTQEEKRNTEFTEALESQGKPYLEGWELGPEVDDCLKESSVPLGKNLNHKWKQGHSNWWPFSHIFSAVPMKMFLAQHGINAKPGKVIQNGSNQSPTIMRGSDSSVVWVLAT